MNSREGEPRSRGTLSEKTSTIQSRIAHFYYAHGLFCSSHPITLLSIAISVVLLACYPLLNLPLPGNSPLQIWTSSINSSSKIHPFCYIQQVVIKSAVLPWGEELNLADAFRAPLYESFKLLDVVRNYHDETSSKTLGHVCLHVEAIRKSGDASKSMFPEYSCLVLSPANLWQQDVIQFAQDSSLLTTVFNYHNFQKGKTSITEMMFGMKVFNTGIKRYPLRSRYRVIQYAITLYLKQYDKQFINGLRAKLHSLYPLHQSHPNETEQNTTTFNDTLIIQYPGEINFVEFIPMSISFLILFLYFYFSSRKVELIYAKLGMAFTSVVTLAASLTMTYGLCFFFGLTLNLEGKVVFPYLVLLVGLENILCLTRSVASSPGHLDVKIRIAQGLSKEGWSITKNLLIEITILTFGIFTFVAVIQEFCIFAIVGLVTDYFMQMMFFSTVLGIDMRRRENVVEKSNFNFRNSFYENPLFYDRSRHSIRRTKSHPRLSFPTNVIAGQAQGAQEKKIPKRLKLVHIWTRTRFFHRSFMILMVIWICNITYNSGIIEHYINKHYFEKRLDESKRNNSDPNYSTIKLFPLLNTSNTFMDRINYVTHTPMKYKYQQNETNFEEDYENLKHSHYPTWLKLSPQHWSSVVRKYNFSLSGHSIAILPVIQISHVIRPDQAILLRNPYEKYGEKFQWQALAAALDPMEFPSIELDAAKTIIPQSEQPFYPTSVFAMAMITILCLISVIVLVYTVVVLYRCICSRNYAEWRASWFYNEKSEESSDEQVLLEAAPVILEGHQQDIECIASDGVYLVSSSLDGQLKVWDSSTGELLVNVERKSCFSENDDYCVESDCDNDNSSDYESGSPPTKGELYAPPHIKKRIDTNFSKLKENPRSYDAKREFNRAYRDLYVGDKSSKLKKRVKEPKRFEDVKSRSFSESNRNCSVDSSNCGEDEVSASHVKISQIWCMDYLDNLIVIGCANGRLEFWEANTGILKTIFEDGNETGVNNVKIVGSKIVASRLYGMLELFQLQTYSHGRPVDWNFSCAYRRTHIRTGSFGSEKNPFVLSDSSIDQNLSCLKIVTVKAHQQPIICLDCEGGRILTGSQDHTLKVFRLEDGAPLYTLHGHCGPITCMFIDRINPVTSGSGSQDGMLCVWDLITGTCMYNIQAHDGTITSLTYSASYVISLGTDDRLCVWERFQGYLLNTIYISQNYSSQILMLTPHLVVTARSGGLVIYDVRSGEFVRTIPLGLSPFVFIKQMILLRDAVFCDYGHQLRIVRFPLITHKFD